MTWARVAPLTDVRPGQGKGIAIGGRTIALFNAAGTVYAVDDECPHAKSGRLSAGTLEDLSVWCPLHDACFDLVTGAILSPPAGETMDEGVRVYTVKILDGDIYLAL